ncbi:MAG TPA: class E sortase, partial [Acidimicrobiales bacterium]
RADFLDVLDQAAEDAVADDGDGGDGDGDGGEGATSTTAVPAPLSVPTGDGVANIRIPKIGLEKVVVEGVSVAALKKGPGHYPTTPLPGQPGNAAIAGHRTTYGSPFSRLDELDPGDRIEVRTRQGEFTYEVSGTQIVTPDQNEVLNPTDENRLTLTTCHPRYSAAKRMIVTARLIDNPVPGPPPVVGAEPGDIASEDVTDDGDGEGEGGDGSGEAGGEGAADEGPSLSDDASVSGESVSKWPAVGWGGLAALIWLLTALLSKRWGRIPAYAMGAPVFFVVLFVFFENFARLLPANV